MQPLVNVAICAVVGAIMVKQPLNGLGAVIYESMGSFLALVGFIIMLGSGLGMAVSYTHLVRSWTAAGQFIVSVLLPERLAEASPLPSCTFGTRSSSFSRVTSTRSPRPGRDT